MKPFEPCLKCKDTKTPGLIQTPEGVTECTCRIEHNGYERLTKYLLSRGIPEKYADYDIKEYIGTTSLPVIKAMERIVDSVGSKAINEFQLYISGKPNTQKTSVGIYLLKSLALIGKQIRYVTMYNLTEILKAKAFGDDTKEDWVVRDIGSTDILMIDDAFDTEKLYFSDKKHFIKTLLLNFLQSRNTNLKSTIYLSRVTRSNIDSRFGSTIHSILDSNCAELILEDVIPTSVRNSKLLGIIQSELKGK